MTATGTLFPAGWNWAGIPESVKSFNVYVTDATREMKKVNKVQVANGKVNFTLEAQAYTSLMTN